MIRLAFMLAPVFLLQAQSALAAPWGAPDAGLSCRVTLLPDTLLEGAYLKLAVEFLYRPPDSGPPIQMLNRERLDNAYVVHLRHRIYGSMHERRIQTFGPDPGFGSCGEYAFAPLTQSLEPDTLAVRMLNPGGDVVIPGDYDVWVVYTKQGRLDLPERLRTDYGDVFWGGQITSPPVSLTVRPDPRDEIRVWTNSRICMVTEGDNCFWTWDVRDSTEIKFRPRPGHGVGRKFDVYRLGEDGERDWISGGHGGGILDREVLEAFGGCGTPDRLLVTVTVFETAVYGRFSVGSSDSTLYRELWTRSFELDPETTPACPGPWALDSRSRPTN